LACAEEQNSELVTVREALAEKETTIDQLREQVTSLLHEVSSLSEAYARLQVFIHHGQLCCSIPQYLFLSFVYFVIFNNLFLEH